MLIPKKVIRAFELKILEWNNELNLKELIPSYEDIKARIIKETNKTYATLDIELKELEKLKVNRRKTKNRWIKSEPKINLKKLQQINEWANEDTPLIMFPYISNKTGKSLTTAIKNDMTIELYTLILNADEIKEEDLIKKEKREVSGVPNLLTSIPYNTSKNGGFENIGEILSNFDETVEVSRNSITTDKYSFVIEFDDEEPKTRLDLVSPKNVKKAMDKILQVINKTDRDIYNYIISRRDAEFTDKGVISIPVKDVVTNVFDSDGGKNYFTLKTSLFKMEKIKGLIGNKKYYTSIGLISRHSFVNEYGVDILIVEIHSYMRDEIIKKHTINLYKDVIDNCPNDDCELMLYFLQRKRLGLVLAKKPLTITVKWYSYFSEVLIFTNKRKDKNIARLELALDFVEGTKSILDFYERKRDEITLVFKDMTDDELADLDYSDIFSEEFDEFRNKLIDEPEHQVLDEE